MGEEESKPQQQDYFLLEHISKMTLGNRKKISYYFINPLKNKYIDDLVTQMRKYFKVDIFPQLRTLKQQMNFVGKLQIIKVIASSELPLQDIQFLQNQKKILQIIIFGRTENFTAPNRKIAAIIQNENNLIKVLNQLQEKDMLSMPENNILITDQDTKLLNKYRLNYHCNTNFNGRSRAKLDFITLATYLFPKQQQLIDQFSEKYNLQLEGQQKYLQTLSWAFKKSFYWDLVIGITRNTTDPKKLAYVRLALRDLFEAILYLYRQKSSYRQTYIIMEVTKDQIAKLQKSQGKFLLFTSFVKAYTNQKQANAELKLRPKAIKFIVGSNRKKLDPLVDFGFVVINYQKQNAIFNIYNIFQLQKVQINKRQINIKYGILPMSSIRRKQLERHLLSKQQLDLMRNYDYLEDMMMKIDSQATLLQLSGYFKQSLQLYDKKVDFIRKTNQSQQVMNKCIIYKADALRRSGQFENAEKQYQSTEFKSQKMKLISQIHLAQLYIHRGQEGKFQKIIDQIENKLQLLHEDQKQEYFKARNFIVIRLIKKGSLKKADAMLHDLRLQVTKAYPLTLESKPLIHDIYRSIATCKSKMGKFNQALILLKDTLSWQLVCQGKSANIILTETLIQSVSRSSGNKQQLEQSLSRMKAMSQQIESSENKFGSIIGQDLRRSLSNQSI